MDNFTATEQAYKNGYEQGMKDAVKWQGNSEKGCEYCREYKSIVEENGDFISLDETGRKGIFLEACTCDVVLEAKVQFCPMCGRRLDGGDAE